jgi:hypothetical protein
MISALVTYTNPQIRYHKQDMITLIDYIPPILLFDELILVDDGELIG